MSKLQLPVGENILLAAFNAVDQKRSVSSSELVAEYDRFFKTSVVAPLAQPQIFERFSIVDPAIRLTIQSTTASF